LVAGSAEPVGRLGNGLDPLRGVSFGSTSKGTPTCAEPSRRRASRKYEGEPLARLVASGVQLIADEPVAELGVIGVHVHDRVDQVGVIEVPGRARSGPL
jgi:hypothetical protein